MFMRFVHFRVKPDMMPALHRQYEEHVIPTLHATSGCLYASLIRGVQHADECISMTLWESPAHAAAYEQSGVFGQLVKDAQQFLADSSEWKIHLSDDLELKYEPVHEEPVVSTYNVATQKNGGLIPRQQGDGLYVRIVSPQVHPGKIEELRRIYAAEFLPRMRALKGCRYASLIDNAKDPEKVVSISIWDSKREADDYESSGVFVELTNRVKHTFSEIYQWKMQLERETGKHVMTSEEMMVEGYSVVTGRSFL